MNGWILINKPSGITSNQVLSTLKRNGFPKKIGHVGTLDPLACGVLPIAFGKATKTISLLEKSFKTYEFTTQFGSTTDTLDIDGTITNSCSHIPSKKEIEIAIKSFIGNQEQTPPIYSAIRISGKRAYDLARKNQDITMPTRVVTINKLELLEYEPSSCSFEVECSSGTYVRAIARDIAIKCSSLGFVTALKRTKLANITIDMCDNLSQAISSPRIYFPNEIFPDIPVINIEKSFKQKILNGNSVLVPSKELLNSEQLCFASIDDQLVALGKITGSTFHPLKLLI